ncbi:MAG: hypothetical protein ABJL67_08725 [Sulfitobacter sp.]
MMFFLEGQGMAIEGLTQEQSDFVERFLMSSFVSTSARPKDQRLAAIEDFRKFNAAYALLRDQIRAVADTEVQARLLGELDAAEALVEADPAKLNFPAGHDALQSIEAETQHHQLSAEAETVLAELSKTMDEWAIRPTKAEKGTADAQSDIELTWTFIQLKMESGRQLTKFEDFDTALRAMARLKVMLKTAKAQEDNPFQSRASEAEGAVEAGQETLLAPRRLADLFDQNAALNEKLVTQFGEDAVPLGLRLACSAVKNKLEEAQTAADSVLSEIADDAESGMKDAARSAEEILAAAQAWTRAHAAYRVRHLVMEAHPHANDTVYVKPAFDAIRAGYTAAKALAVQHNYVDAAAALDTLRNDLKDALDIADDFATYQSARTENRALLATLPDVKTYPLSHLQDDHVAALTMLETAQDEFDAGKLVAALALLNAIPRAVEDIRQEHRFASQFMADKAQYLGAVAAFSEQDTEIRGLLSTELEAADATYQEAIGLADEGDYKRAAARMKIANNHVDALAGRALIISGYLEEASGFASRLKDITTIEPKEGRQAIEGYCEAMAGDEAKRSAAHEVGDFRLAHAMCVRLKSEHEEMMERAARAALYYQELASFDAEFAALTAATSNASLQTREAVEKMRENAVAASIRDNWMGAKNMLENAILEVRRAVSDAETAALIDGMQGNNGTFDFTEDTDDAEFEASYTNFSKILSYVRGLDTQDMFEDELDQADVDARSAKDLIKTDWITAETTLNLAVQYCRDVADSLSEFAGFSTQWNATNAVINEAERGNTKGLVDAEIAAARSALEAAKAEANPPSLDFAAGFSKLAEAQGHARRGGDAMAAYYKTIYAAELRITGALNVYKEHDNAEYFEGPIAQLDRINAQMNEAFTERDLRGAAQAAADGVALADLQDNTLSACKAALDSIERTEFDRSTGNWAHPVISKEVEEMLALQEQAGAALANGNFGLVQALSDQSQRIAAGARAKAIGFDMYLPREIAAKRGLDQLEPRAVAQAGPGFDAVLALRKRFDGAVEKKALENFAGAVKLLEGFETAVEAASEELDLYDRYVLLLERAEAALERVKQNNSPAIETLLVRLEGAKTSADKLGQAFDFTSANVVLTELIADCEIAVGSATTIDDFLTENKMIAAIADEDTDDLKRMIANAEAKLASLAMHPSAIYVTKDLQAAQTLIKSAEVKTDDDFAAARLEITSVLDTCVALAAVMAKYDVLNDTADRARDLADALLLQTPQVALVRDDIHAYLGKVHVAITRARAATENRAQAQTDLDAIVIALRDMAPVLKDHQRYLTTRATVQTALDRLEKSSERAILREDFLQVRRHLDTAQTRATAHRHEEAFSELKAAADRLELAKLRAKLMTNDPPNATEIQAILEGPGGTEAFDQMVDALPPLAQEQVMKAAFQARFGCELLLLEPATQPTEFDADGKPLPVTIREDENRDAPALNLRAFYEEMQRLPESSTLDNDSLLVFDIKGGTQEASAYQGRSKTIQMREGDEDASRIYSVAVEHEIGELDERALPKPGEERTAFSWNTLHEVGHAVDDKLGYMKKHGERLAGWKTYGANVKEPAKAIADKFKFDADYIAEYMVSSQGTGLPMPDPVGCGLDEWHRRMEEARLFVDQARESNRPWASASISKACAIGEYTYVESYPKDWNRYRTTARQLAVTGYQFRAPGEWFSELYAALFTDRLNDNHPHRQEMEDVCQRVVA